MPEAGAARVFVGPRPPLQVEAKPVAVLPDEAAMCRVLRAVVAASGLTQDEIAERMGIAQQDVSKALTGNVKRPSWWWATRLISACGGRVLVELPK